MLKYDGKLVPIDAGSLGYEPSGSNVLSIIVPGDGKKHLLEVIDSEDPSIRAFTEVQVKDCQDIVVKEAVSGRRLVPKSGK